MPLAAVVLRMGLMTAMFRFCWDHREPDARARTIQTAFTAVLRCRRWRPRGGLLFINPLADVLSSSRELVVIGAFGLWVSMNFDIVAGIYRIEQRPTAFVVYSLINVAITVVLSIILVIPLDLGAAGHHDRQLLGHLHHLRPAADTPAARRRRARRSTARCCDGCSTSRCRSCPPAWPSGRSTWPTASRSINLGVAGPSSARTRRRPRSRSGSCCRSRRSRPRGCRSPTRSPTRTRPKRTYRGGAVSYWSTLIAWAVVAISLFAPPYIHLLMPHAWCGTRRRWCRCSRRARRSSAPT